MISNDESKGMSATPRNVLTSFALVVGLLTTLLLTGCVSRSSGPTASLQIYQPPVLRLTSGTVVATRDGIYTVPLDETWHSNQRFVKVEQEAVNLAAALAQLRAQPIAPSAR